MKCYKCGYENEEENLFCIKCGNKIEYDPEFEQNQKYTAAVKAMDSAVSANDYYYAKSLFKEIAEYKDSSSRMEECEIKSKKLQLEETYCNAVRMMNSAHTKKEYIEAKNLFESIPEYKDSKEKASECDEKSEIAHIENIYSDALYAKNSDDPDKIEHAIKQLKTIPEYKDSVSLLKECEKQLSFAFEKRRRIEEEKIKAAQLRKSRRKKRFIIGVSSAAAAILIGIGAKTYYDKVYIPQKEYTDAKSLYESAVQMYQNGDSLQAVELLRKSSKYTEGNLAVSDVIHTNRRLAAGKNFVVALYDNNTVLSEGTNTTYQNKLKAWTDVVSVSVGSNSTIGITSDGKILSIGRFEDIAQDLTDVMEADIYDDNLSVVHSDGTAEYCIGLDHFNELPGEYVAVAAGNNFSVFLKADGTADYVLGNDRADYSVCDVSDWENLYSIDAADDYTLGLKTDGTVVISGGNEEIRNEVSKWTDIVAIAASNEMAAGIKSDGTVVVTDWWISENITQSAEFQNIVEIAITNNSLWCLTVDNRLIFADTSYYSRYDIVETWKNGGISETDILKERFKYETKGSSAAITKYIGEETDVIIPEEIEGKTVTEISDSAFEYSTIESVVLPYTLMSIGSNAFAYCSNLTSIDLSELSNCEINSNAFSCSGLSEIEFPDDFSLFSENIFDNTPWKENALNYDINKTYDLNIDDILTHSFERIGRVYKFEAEIREFYLNRDNILTCWVYANDYHGTESMYISTNTELLDYYDKIDTYEKCTLIFYGLYTGENITMWDKKDCEEIFVPDFTILRIESTENLKFIDQRQYKESGLDDLIEEIDRKDGLISSFDYEPNELWYSIDMIIQEVIPENTVPQYYISGIVDSADIYITVEDLDSYDLAVSSIGKQCTFKVRFSSGSYEYDNPDVDYSLNFDAVSWEVT